MTESSFEVPRESCGVVLKYLELNLTPSIPRKTSPHEFKKLCDEALSLVGRVTADQIEQLDTILCSDSEGDACYQFLIDFTDEELLLSILLKGCEPTHLLLRTDDLLMVEVLPILILPDSQGLDVPGQDRTDLTDFAIEDKPTMLIQWFGQREIWHKGGYRRRSFRA